MSLFINKNEIPWKNSPENMANIKEIIVDPRGNKMINNIKIDLSSKSDYKSKY